MADIRFDQDVSPQLELHLRERRIVGVVTVATSLARRFRELTRAWKGLPRNSSIEDMNDHVLRDIGLSPICPNPLVSRRMWQ
jgi:uncharacterized protein YjiS (DUF1127 family)